MSRFGEVCQQAARAGGSVLQQWAGRFTVREKGPDDLVTEADLAAQEEIRSIVLGRFPDHGFVGEEGRQPVSLRREATGMTWIVDPLDGTSNYARGVPHYCTSVALWCDGQPIAAAVYDPVLDEMFAAEPGEGVTLNGRKVQTSGVRLLRRSLIAASLPAHVTRQLPALTEFVSVSAACRAIRRGGSAALNLAYIAVGRFDGYWSSDLYPWDAAAGVVLVEEAGGSVTNLEGGAFDVWTPKLIAACGPEVHQQLLAILERS